MKSSVSNLDPHLQHDAATKAKGMMRVGRNGRPFLDYLLLNVEKSGYEDVVIVVGEKDNSIQAHYEVGGHAREFSRLQISYVPQRIPAGRRKPLGTADALLQALKATPGWKGKGFTVCNSDNLYSEKALRALLEDTHNNAMIDYDRSALGVKDERISEWAVIVKDGNRWLRDIIEKPSLEEIGHARDEQGRVGVSMNIWRFSYDTIIPFLEKVPFHPLRGEKELPTAVRMMVSTHPASLYTIQLSVNVIDLTSQSDVVAVMEYLKSQRTHF
jgi:glucose-1-phosphate adenylyltransferase